MGEWGVSGRMGGGVGIWEEVEGEEIREKGAGWGKNGVFMCIMFMYLSSIYTYLLAYK